MPRLLVAGCSFTFYKWPTWADYLSNNFTKYINKGIPGADNATIARIVTSMAEPGDTVIVMWSSYARYNYQLNFNGLYNYEELVCMGGSNIDNRSYFLDIFNTFERFATSIDYLQWTITDSILRNYTLVNLSAFPYLTGELGSPITDDMKKLIDIKQWYIDKIEPTDMQTFSQDYKHRLPDNHPTPIAHYDYASQIICPKLNIELKIKREQALADNGMNYV